MPTLKEPSSETKTDWARLRTQMDEDIARAVEADPDSALLQTAEPMRAFTPPPARRKR